jgi:hypothetical protein
MECRSSMRSTCRPTIRSTYFPLCSVWTTTDYHNMGLTLSYDTMYNQLSALLCYRDYKATCLALEALSRYALTFLICSPTCDREEVVVGKRCVLHKAPHDRARCRLGVERNELIDGKLDFI